MKKKLMDLLAKKEARKQELVTKSNGTEDVTELKSINTEMETLNTEITDIRSMIDSLPEEEPKTEGRAAATGALNPIATYNIGQNSAAEARAAQQLEESEKRGKALMEKRSVTVGASNIVTPAHAASDIRPGFNEVSALVDRVNHKPLPGGESFKQPYIAGYGTGDYTNEGADYTEADPIFGYVDINKTKITAYAEDSEELIKLPAADYDREVMKGVRIASRKKITREILIGDGNAGHLAGIFSVKATAIDAATDISIAEIDETTLDTIVFSYGGDEEVEDAAVLVLHKLDLAEFAKLRTADGKRIHTIKTNGNSGTIDGYPFLINSACKAISSTKTSANDYSMAYGPLSNYTLAIFSDLDVQRSDDYAFRKGMIAHRSSVFVGGNVTSKNGFLRVKKS